MCPCPPDPARATGSMMAPPWRPPSWRRALGRGTEPCSVPVCQPALSGVWGGSSTSSMTILSENLKKVSCRQKRGRVVGRPSFLKECRPGVCTSGTPISGVCTSEIQYGYQVCALPKFNFRCVHLRNSISGVCTSEIQFQVYALPKFNFRCVHFRNHRCMHFRQFPAALDQRN